MEIIATLKHALSITFFVYVMMIVVEYLNIVSGGKWEARLCQRRGWQQYILAGVLGIIPGCLGAFAAVTLYSHRFFTLGAIVTTMIATSGDEAFVMLAMFPGKAIQLWVILLVIGIVAGYLVDRLRGERISEISKEECDEMVLHDEEAGQLIPTWQQFTSQLQVISLSRTIILASLSLFIFFLILGEIGPESWNWERVTFVGLGVIGLLMVLTSPQHFLDEHLWQHITKRHLPAIFAWTFGALFVVEMGRNFLYLDQYLGEKELLVMLTSILVGVIPESGPHMVFVTLFAKGTISFLTLLVSSIVQDGHGMLPLLAFSRRAFLKVKLINVGMGLFVGLVGFVLLGFV